MAYYWITEAQKYIQSLGFGDARPAGQQGAAARSDQPVGRRQLVRHRHPKDELRFGKGGVDDAEDAEVILHEYGHAIQFSQNFSFASEEAGSISEGFGDYWAVTSRASSSARSARRPEPAVRRRLGLDVVHAHGAALPAPRRPEPALPGPT